MQIDLLGPLRIVHDGTDITPSAPKLRQVFTLLATCANTVVPHERFVEELWEFGPPTSVTTTLQTYVYQLRKMLGLARSQNGNGIQPALKTSHGGYTLSLPLTTLDSHRFESAVRQGSQQLEAGNTYEAATNLAEALELWRGPALVDVELGPILSCERLRLEELRKTALERRIEADLALGRHSELVGELSGLLSRAPTNERFAIQLMLALHRSGNRAEALRVYERVRSDLVEELGLDPCPDLHQLHTAVLNSDKSLVLAPRPSPLRIALTPTPPCHLPPRAGPLIGRQDELALALKGISTPREGGPPVVVITGSPGSGKTALCVHASYETRGYFPDGQLFAQLTNPDGRLADVGEVLAGFLRALGIREELIPANVEQRSQLFRSHTADKQVLVVLDDMVRPDQLCLLPPIGTGCGLIVSCRKRFSHPAVGTLIELLPLNESGGVGMLIAGIGEHRVQQDLEAALLLVAMCDGLPTAVRSCIDKLRARPHWTLRRAIRWVEEGQCADGQGPSDVLNLKLSIERTYWSLGPDVREVFGLFTDRLSGVLSAPTVADALALDEHEAETLLEDLAEAQLIHIHHCGNCRGDQFCYECLPTIRASSRDLPLSRSQPAPPAPHARVVARALSADGAKSRTRLPQ